MDYAKKLEKKPLGGAATEGGAPTGVAAPPIAAAGDRPSVVGSPSHPDPQVTLKPVRRRLDKAYKWSILQQADACVGRKPPRRTHACPNCSVRTYASRRG